MLRSISPKGASQTLEAFQPMLHGYADLTGSPRERAKVKMEDVQHQFDLIRRDIIDSRLQFDEFERELAARNAALERATEALSNGAASRQKTEVMSAVVAPIACHFRLKAGKGNTHNGEYYLDKVEIVPVSGDSVCFTDGNKLSEDHSNAGSPTGPVIVRSPASLIVERSGAPVFATFPPVSK